MTEDTKILAAVASIVVIGAVALAVGSWMSLEDEADAQSMKVTSTLRSQIQAEPASFSPRETIFGPPVAEITPAEIAEIEEPGPAFSVQPGENFVARGIETFEGREFDNAVAYFRAAVEERPEQAWTQYMLGLSLWKVGQLDEASAEMSRAAELDAKSIKTFVNLSRIENDRAEFGAALEAARSALEIDPENATALFLEGRSLRNLDRTEQALESLQRSVEIDPDNGYAHNLLGLTLLESGRSVEAVEALEVATSIEGEVAYIQNNLGMALEHEGRTAEALTAYARAAELNPAHEHAAAHLARLEPLVSEPIEVTVKGVETESDVDTIEVAEAAIGEQATEGESRP